MTKSEILTAIAAILTTALETEPGLFPESMAYLAATGGNIHDWQTVRHILLTADMVTIEGNIIRLTDNGRDLARKCNASLAKRGDFQ